MMSKTANKVLRWWQGRVREQWLGPLFRRRNATTSIQLTVPRLAALLRSRAALTPQALFRHGSAMDGSL